MGNFLNEKGIVKNSEDPMVTEIKQGVYNRTEAIHHYKFKTQKGSFISTDPDKDNHKRTK